jgi:hypothetical protein
VALTKSLGSEAIQANRSTTAATLHLGMPIDGHGHVAKRVALSSRTYALVGVYFPLPRYTGETGLK